MSRDAAYAHAPVLVREVLEGLRARPGSRFIDATVGQGGHASALLDATSPDGLLLGLDRDAEAVARSAARLAHFGERCELVQGSFAELDEVAAAAGWRDADGVLMDLGFSSSQVDDPERGFSFRADGPLDMRYDRTAGVTARELINGLPEAELADLLYAYGDEHRSRRIARAIVAARPIATTTELARVIAAAVGMRGRIHPATRSFQALRIAVNEELDAIERGLAAALRLLLPGGRIAVISFHSLEDRIVKNRFREESRGCICPPELPECRCAHVPSVRLVTRKPLQPGLDEIARNPRARSARLRIAERLDSSLEDAA